MNTLSMPPASATLIGTSCFSFSADGDRVVYFSNLEPFDSHEVSNRRAMLLRIARFAEHGVRREELQEAFGVGRSTVQRAVNVYRRRGEEGFHEPRRGRGPSVIDAGMAREADRLLSSGLSGSAVARQLGISVRTLNDNRRRGVVGGGQRGTGASAGCATAAGEASGPRAATDRGARDRRDRVAPMGRGARDTTGRVLAATGHLTEVEPRFAEPLSAVSGGGVLAGLPMLLQEGLLGRAQGFLSLPKGYYGLSTVLLFLAFLFLARVRNPEALRHQAPGEWGAILGLDRCPEVKTLRRKIKALGWDARQVRAWQASLAAAWMAEEPEVCATLSVDGHVKVYSGRKGRLPKHFVSRQKLCLPASTSYWINALGGKPFLCLNKALDPTLTHALEEDILPALETLGVLPPDAPDLTVRDAGEPALTLVFDREGWSPALFRRLARRGVAVITWHKGFKGEAWPEADFQLATIPIHGPGGSRSATVRLAEKRVQLKQGPEVRQIRRLLDNGRQMPLVTTHFHIPMEQVAGALFSRWSQENFFKYMREEFNLDALAVHGLEMQDPEARVVNPPPTRTRAQHPASPATPRHPAQPDRRSDPGSAVRHGRRSRPEAPRRKRRARRRARGPQAAAQRHPATRHHRRPRRTGCSRRTSRRRETPPRRHPNDRLPGRNPHDARRRTGAGQEPTAPQAPARAPPGRRRHHPRARKRDPSRPHPRHRIRRRRQRHRSPPRGTQPDPDSLPGDQPPHGL